MFVGQINAAETPHSVGDAPNYLLGGSHLVPSKFGALLVQMPNYFMTILFLLVLYSQEHLICRGLGVIKESRKLLL